MSKNFQHNTVSSNNTEKVLLFDYLKNVTRKVVFSMTRLFHLWLNLFEFFFHACTASYKEMQACRVLTN
jgi:hypothetical protein